MYHQGPEHGRLAKLKGLPFNNGPPLPPHPAPGNWVDCSQPQRLQQGMGKGFCRTEAHFSPTEQLKGEWVTLPRAGERALGGEPRPLMGSVIFITWCPSLDSRLSFMSLPSQREKGSKDIQGKWLSLREDDPKSCPHLFLSLTRVPNSVTGLHLVHVAGGVVG